jgi:hypothetical protein
MDHDEGDRCLQHHLMRYEFIGHNFGYGLPLVSSASTYTQNTHTIENIRSYTFGLWVSGQPRWRCSDEKDEEGILLGVMETEDGRSTHIL